MFLTSQILRKIPHSSPFPLSTLMYPIAFVSPTDDCYERSFPAAKQPPITKTDKESGISQNKGAVFSSNKCRQASRHGQSEPGLGVFGYRFLEGPGYIKQERFFIRINEQCQRWIMGSFLSIPGPWIPLIRSDKKGCTFPGFCNSSSRTSVFQAKWKSIPLLIDGFERHWLPASRVPIPLY